ncbi:MAG: CmcJ/NvfI family oxidoreductase [Myxococcota bacterium]
MSHYCRAAMNYVTATDVQAREVEILDGRRLDGLSWEESGFELIRHASEVENWALVDASTLHYDEIGALARRLTGCDAVLYYPALVRNRANAQRSEDLAPIRFVHSDYTESYREMIEDADHPYRAILAPFMERAGITGDDIARARRILTLQFWRNIGPARMSHPLAFCDARTVVRSDLHPLLVSEYGGIPTGFYSFGVSAPSTSPGHRWVTFPEMTPEEVVVFRAYDSDRVAAGQPFWTPHSAFVDPVAGADAPPRESIEMRAICLFDG